MNGCLPYPHEKLFVRYIEQNVLVYEQICLISDLLSSHQHIFSLKNLDSGR
jgi:hypothetical protein